MTGAEVPNFMKLFAAAGRAHPTAARAAGVFPNWVFNGAGTFYKGSR
jgi:hypothetical protein